MEGSGRETSPRDEGFSACGVDWRPKGGSYEVVRDARARWTLPARMLAATPVPMLAALTPGYIALYVVGVLLWLQALLKLLALPFSGRAVGANDPDLWPRYTVLVPLYRERDSLPRLLLGLSGLDYPADRLQILLVCEADDHETLDALPELSAPFELVRVPDGGPRTKPKALRVAMARASGEIVTIYDAEDVPHPAQLKCAARALLADPALAAVQAPLRVDNLHPGWITRQFAMEYASLFYAWVPALARAGVAVPLGGTSNHIRRTALEAAGGWDPFNVTEDADLSFRLALAPDCRFGWISLPTEEEAVASFRAWRHQRTRWFKGFAQTWLAHMRRPFAGSWRRWAALHVTIGLTLLSALLHLPTLFLLAALLGTGIDVPMGITLAGAAFYSSGILVAAVASRRAGLVLRFRDLATLPLYWALLTWPAWAALWDLVRRPSYWHKTAHGVSARMPFPEHVAAE